MKNNYPIKYAVMPIMEQSGYGLDRHNQTVAYIVSKCYLIGEHKKYCSNGNIKIQYEIVFPYKESEYNFWDRDEPEYNYITEKCVNSIFVETICNTYQEALVNANQKNKSLLSETMNNILVDSNFNEVRKKETKEYWERLMNYQQLEQEMEQKTDDLNVDETLKEQTVIIFSEDKKKKLMISLYNVMGIFNSQKYCVYNLNIDEYQQILTAIEEGFPLDEYNKRCLMINDPSQDIVRINNYDNENECFYLVSHNLIPYKEAKDIIFNDDKDNIVFYTLETYEDVIKSLFPKHGRDWELKINNKIMTKKIRKNNK